MNSLFLIVLNMSLTGAFVISAICLIRLPLKRLPKIISYCLWAVAGFRLVVPVTIESALSLIPFRAGPALQGLTTAGDGLRPSSPSENTMHDIYQNITGIFPSTERLPSDVYQNTPHTEAVGISESLVAHATNLANLNWIDLGTFIWLVGFSAMMANCLLSYIIIKRKMRGATNISGRVYESKNTKSPFVFGMIKPAIFLPVGLTQSEHDYVLLHEMTHIRRHDHIIKFFAYFVLSLHWFNPLAWLAFLLMSADMEMSCDESVIKELGQDARADYSRSLLSFAGENRYSFASPLAFGEGGLKERVKNLLNFKKSSRVAVICAVILVAVTGLGLMTNRSSTDKIPENDTVDYFSNTQENNTRDYVPNVENDNETAHNMACIPDSAISHTIETNRVAPLDTSRFDRWNPFETNEAWVDREGPFYIQNALMHLDPSLPEGEAFRLVLDSLEATPLPEGWHLIWSELGGSQHFRFIDFDTHSIMLQPYSIAFDVVVIDTMWSLEGELVLLDKAKMVLENFDELLAVSIRAQMIYRENGETFYKVAQLTRERVPKLGEDRWCDGNRVPHFVPFYAGVVPDFKSIYFEWRPAGFETDEVMDIIYTLSFENLGLEISYALLPLPWPHYGTHIYSFSIGLSWPQGVEGYHAITDEVMAELAEITSHLFDVFDELLQVTYFFDVPLEEGGIRSYPNRPVFRHWVAVRRHGS